MYSLMQKVRQKCDLTGAGTMEKVCPDLDGVRQLNTRMLVPLGPKHLRLSLLSMRLTTRSGAWQRTGTSHCLIIDILYTVKRERSATKSLPAFDNIVFARLGFSSRSGLLSSYRRLPCWRPSPKAENCSLLFRKTPNFSFHSGYCAVRNAQCLTQTHGNG
ncbi:hypothetical protein GQ43DRAFT_157743 [Delitschia confertaspora ATCC 74209]|uniref:Uncharacterized protein n=1 Tax=Delitschia confertaspora ATCC 74209 TaxID=1513339 RepID=A0A9P4JL11_9PLEO|nr:hypothetical protein GQ43DRAFT_157743 [Delitschia confertaspora ATCC 74209]